MMWAVKMGVLLLFSSSVGDGKPLGTIPQRQHTVERSSPPPPSVISNAQLLLSHLSQHGETAAQDRNRRGNGMGNHDGTGGGMGSSATNNDDAAAVVKCPVGSFCGCVSSCENAFLNKCMPYETAKTGSSALAYEQCSIVWMDLVQA